MARNKSINNGNGTDLTISYGNYISVGKNGRDIVICGNGRTIFFDTWEDLVSAIDVAKSAFARDEKGSILHGELKSR